MTNCPHCYNTLKNEYPVFGSLGENIEILHHSQFLFKLMNEGKLNVQDSMQSFTFHDPCYLGRYNDEYEAPRKVLKKAKGLKIIEMEKSKEKGMCCGAGGGHFWMDLKEGERVNVKRAQQAQATEAQKIATACPFCMQMMEDGLKILSDEKTVVADIAEVIAELL